MSIARAYDPLVTAEYVASMTGVDVSDAARVSHLIEEATYMVQEYLGRTFSPGTAPSRVRQAIAVMVAGALSGPGGSSSIKSEQIGDYRVEFAGADRFGLGLDIRRAEHLLAGLASGVRSVRTDLAFDGLTDALAAAAPPPVSDGAGEPRC